MDLRPGLEVTSNVELVRPLEKGGMGSVWVARHHGLETEVAVKFVQTEGKKKERPKALRRFKREAAAAAKLTSPHVVRTFDYGVMGDDFPYIVMELLKGETLTDRLRGGRTLSLRELRSLMQQLCGVLGSAHELGIIHRDVKPDNLFLIESEYDLFIKVLDFGIARESEAPSAITESGALVGTPRFMSPEQLLGESDLDGRTDLWSAAVVAYRALTGRIPFDGHTLAALSMAICNSEAAPPSRILADCPPELDDFFESALAKNRDDRFPDARSMMDALAVALDEAEVGGTRRRSDVPAADDPEATVDAPMAPVSDVSLGSAPTVPSDAVEGRSSQTLGGASQTLAGSRRRNRAGIVAAVVAAAALVVVVRQWPANEAPASVAPAASPTVSNPRSQLPTPSAVSAPSSTATAVSTSSAPEVAASAPPSASSAAPEPAPPTRPRVKPRVAASPPIRPPAPDPQPVVDPEPEPKPTTASCNPPWYVDENNVKIPRPECLK